MEFYAFRDGNKLAPADAESAAVLSKFRMGKPIKLEGKQSRHGGRHRLYWLMVTRIANAIGAEPENVSDVLKIETGHCVTVKTGMTTYKFPRSISYSKMDDAEHHAFFERCVAVVQTQWAIKSDDVRRELADILEPQTELRA